MSTRYLITFFFMLLHFIVFNSIDKTINKTFKTHFMKFSNIFQWHKKPILDYKALKLNQ